MKMNKIFLLIAMLVFFALPAYAATTFVTPGASATITGASYAVNITTSDLGNLLNCSITGSSALTGDSLSLTTFTNESGGATTVNGTIDTTTLEDATDWIFAGNCYNASSPINSSTITSRTGVTVDNTVPTAPSSITPSTSKNKGSIAVSSTVTGARTTSCTITATSSYHTQTETMTHSGNTCSKTISLPGSGSWILTLIASDGTNTTSATSNLKVDESKSIGSTTPTTTSKPGVSDEKMKQIAIIVIVLGVIYYFTQDNKGSGGRKRKR